MEDKNKLYTYEYPRPAVTTDCVVFGYDLKGGLSVLLIERGADPYKGRWAFPGGFLICLSFHITPEKQTMVPPAN